MTDESRVARIHANRLMEELITSGKDVTEIKGWGRWFIRVSHCIRNGNRSGGINIESFLIKDKFKTGHCGYIDELKFKGRLKKSWNSKQLRRMFDTAYKALQLEKGPSTYFLQEGKKNIYTNFTRFYNGNINGFDILTKKHVVIAPHEYEPLTMTPEEWYTSNNMKNSLALYRTKQQHAKKHLG